MGLPSFLIPTFIDRFFGFLLFLALGWFVILEPAWFGMKQAFGFIDSTSEAMAGFHAGLRRTFEDIEAVARASVPDLVVNAGLRALEDLFGGRATIAAKDAALLIARAKSTYQEFNSLWAPQIQELERLPASKRIKIFHGFWGWLQSPEVLPVIKAAGRRLGLGEDVSEESRRKLKSLLDSHAPDLAHGFWYGLYATVVLQLFVLECFYAWGRPRPLFWAAWSLVGFNLTKGVLLLIDMLELWPVRREIKNIAATLEIPNLIGYALRLMGGQVLGVVTMLLFVVRFLALGEAMHGPGNVLSGIHGTLIWIWGFYIEVARAIF